MAAYVVWAPRNGAKEKHVPRVTSLVDDNRTTQYWDGAESIADPYDEMLNLTGPCAGIFMIFGREARWGESGPPRPDYFEDAHADEYDREGPQFDDRRFAARARAELGR